MTLPARCVRCRRIRGGPAGLVPRVHRLHRATSAFLCNCEIYTFHNDTLNAGNVSVKSCGVVDRGVAADQRMRHQRAIRLSKMRYF